MATTNNTNTVSFKEVPRLSSLNLHQYDRAKYPGCLDGSQLRIVKGRWVTGFDEYAAELSFLPAEEKQAEFERRKAKREKFQNLLGIEDLSGTSNYWNEYLILISVTTPLDLNNPVEEMAFEIIKANRLAMPSTINKHDIGYENVNYVYILNNEEVTDKVMSIRNKNRAIAELELLYTDNPSKLNAIGRYLNLPVRENTPNDNVYDIINTFIQTEGPELFIHAMSISTEEINTKILFRSALKHKVIRQNGSIFQRGNITIGNSEQKAVEYLLDPSNSGELLSIQEELEYKKTYA